jgi:diketogulonate reductase-like aldo/keto reductase
MDAMTTAPIPTHALNDGLVLPAIGFGTWPLRGDDAVAAVRSALDVGYRLLDTAVNYENEAEVGLAVRESAVPRAEILVQTKVPGRFHARDLAIRSVEDSLRRMHLDVLDLVLVHWPNPSQGRYVEVVEALLTCRERGLVRSVGVSNYTERLLDEVIEATGFTPSVNQVELHPSFPQAELVARHEFLGIRTQAWSPLARMESEGDGDDPLTRIAAAQRISPAQAVLAWHVARGIVPLPKSADPARQAANLAALEITLTPDEVATITALGRPDGRLFHGDPETHEED